jgi:hypothetical protein
MNYGIYKLGIIVKPEGEPIYSEMATNITIDDASGGVFVCITQNTEDSGKILINPNEWPVIKAAIDEMFVECSRIDSEMAISEVKL